MSKTPEPLSIEELLVLMSTIKEKRGGHILTNIYDIRLDTLTTNTPVTDGINQITRLTLKTDLPPSGRHLPHHW